MYSMLNIKCDAHTIYESKKERENFVYNEREKFLNAWTLNEI